MQTIQNDPFGGPLSIHDPATGQHIQATVSGQWSVSINAADVQGTLQWAKDTLMRMLTEVVAGSVARGEVAVVALPQSVPHLLDRVMPQFSQSLSQYGMQLHGLNLTIHLPPGAGAHAQPMSQPAPSRGEGPAQPEYELQANIRVGGFDIGMNSNKGLDEAGLVDQAKDKLKWWLIGIAITVVAVLIVVGVIGYSIWKTKEKLEDTGAIASDDDSDTSGERKVVEWDGKKPYKCSDKGRVVIRGVKANIDKGTAVEVTSSCNLLLEDVEIVAGDTAVKAFGKGEVTIKGGTIEGKKTALEAVGAQTKIVVEGAKIVGKTKAVGGKIEGI